MDTAAIIGAGFIKVEFCCLSIRDSNTHQHRTDLVVHRVGGSGTRLHPTSSSKLWLATGLRDAYPVHGMVVEWIPALGAPQGRDGPGWTNILARTVAERPMKLPVTSQCHRLTCAAVMWHTSSCSSG